MIAACKSENTNWASTKLGDITYIVLGQSPPSSTYNENGAGLPFYQGKLEFGDLHPTPRQWCDAPKKISESGDVLISVRAPVGPTNICQEKSCIGRGLAALRPLGGIETLFVLYLMRNKETELAGKGTGTTFGAITGDHLKNLPLPLPPLNEQKRIVAKIEELFTKLDAGVESLKKVKAQIKRYRQAVLKAAFEGTLTKEWRNRNTWPSCRQEAEFSIFCLPPLPASWCWIGIGNLKKDVKHALKAGPFGSALKKEFYVKEGYKIYGQEQVINDNAFYGNYYIDKHKYEELENCRVQPNDALISLVGTVGQVLILPPNCQQGIINPRLVKISLDPDKYLPLFFKYYFLSSLLRSLYKELLHGSTMDVLNLGILKQLPFPLPPLPEQHQIVSEIERRFSVADEADKIVDQSLKQAERLRQSILKRAFAGKLVPQDPNDEPASVLLERIRAEKARLEAEGKVGKKKMKKVK